MKYKFVRKTLSGGYSLEEAVNLSRSGATAKFDETIDIAINLGLDPRKPNQSLRGVAPLPFGTGKPPIIAVFAKGPKAEEALKAGADVVGDADLIQKIEKGEINFTKCIATPDMMPMVGRVARILGPRGLMPNPKTGTITQDVVEAVKASKQGQVDFKTDKKGVVHVPLGKASFRNEQIIANVNALVSCVIANKPEGAKGDYFRSAYLNSTMGPSFQLNIRQEPFYTSKKAKRKSA